MTKYNSACAPVPTRAGGSSGVDVWRIKSGFDSSTDHAEVSDRFQKLASRWKRESSFMSSPLDMAALPSYLQIIAMGPDVVPLILDELREEPDQWFVALALLTGADPVPDHLAGQVDQMAAAWLEWGAFNGY
jgi:hypothetical protein